MFRFACCGCYLDGGGFKKYVLLVFKLFKRAEPQHWLWCFHSREFNYSQLSRNIPDSLTILEKSCIGALEEL